jgi:hypothetical protein
MAATITNTNIAVITVPITIFSELPSPPIGGCAETV